MYDAHDKKTLGLPDVYTLDNSDKYVTFSHADIGKEVALHDNVSEEPDLTNEELGAQHPDSIIFATPLQNFVYEVSKGFRHAYKFATSAYHLQDGKRPPDRRRRVYMYDPSCLYPMGWVGYDDFSIKGNQAQKYTVCSLHINNLRFDDTRDQHRMLVTDSMAVALKNALKHLQPVTHRDVLVGTWAATANKVSQLGMGIQNAMREKVQGLGVQLRTHGHGDSQPQVWTELCYLLDCEHAFISDEFRDTIVAVRESLHEMDANTCKVVNLHCVRVYERSGKQFYDVIPVDDVTRVNSSSFQSINRANQALQEHRPVRYDNDTIPEDIYAKMTVLSICDKGEFVEDVGHRNQDTVYYVYR